MLTPFTPGNGGTYVLPCSHRREPGEPEGGFHGLGFPTSSLGDGQIPPHPDTVHVTGEAGCVCCFDGRLWHAAAPNRTEDQPRVMVNLRFAAAHLLEPAVRVLLCLHHLGLRTKKKVKSPNDLSSKA